MGREREEKNNVNCGQYVLPAKSKHSAHISLRAIATESKHLCTYFYKISKTVSI